MDEEVSDADRACGRALFAAYQKFVREAAKLLKVKVPDIYDPLETLGFPSQSHASSGRGGNWNNVNKSSERIENAKRATASLSGAKQFDYRNGVCKISDYPTLGNLLNAMSEAETGDDNTGHIQSAKADPPPIVLPDVPATQLWQELTLSDFQPPEGETFQREAREFLRGKENVGWWTAVHVAVQRPALMGRLMLQAENAPVVIAHGPVGEGKTVLLRQLAHNWLVKGQPVFWLLGEGALQDTELVTALDRARHPLLILDQYGLNQPLPEWVALAGGQGVTLALGIQTRQVQKQRRAAGARNAREIKLTSADAKPVCDAILDQVFNFDAADDLNPNSTRDKFHDGLGLHGDGGLWCAMWQATRGQHLKDKFQALVQEFHEDDAKFGALAAIVFVNGMREFSNQKLDDLARSRVAGMIRHLGLNDGAEQSRLECLGQIGKLLDGEFLQSGIDELADPRVQLRHPAVTHGFFQHIFGARNILRGEQMTAKWPFFLALGHAYAESEEYGDVAHIIREHGKAWLNSSKSSQFRAGMKSHKFFETTKNLVDLIPLDQWSPESNLSLAHAALEAGIPGSRPELEDREYGKQRLIIALSDDRCTPSQRVTGADLLRQHPVAGHAWRDHAIAAWTAEKRPEQKRKLAYNIFKIYCEDARTTPEEIKTWAFRSHIETGEAVGERAHVSLRHLANRCREKKFREQHAHFCSGPAIAKDLGSIRAIYRTFWRLASSDRNATGKSLHRILKDVPLPPVANNEIKPLIVEWFEFDKDNTGQWPTGVIERLGAIRDDPSQWLAFLRSYEEYFSSDVRATPPPSATPR